MTQPANRRLATEAFVSAEVADLTVADASTTVKGIVELATNTETTTGTDTARAVTPAGVKAVADTKAAASHTHGVTDLTATGTPDATTFLAGDNTWKVPAGSGASSLTPTAVKTAAYTAAAGDLVRADASAGIVTVTLPASAPVGALVGVKKMDSVNFTNLSSGTSANGQVSIVPSAGDTIDGLSVVNIGRQYFSRIFRKDSATTWVAETGLTTTGADGAAMSTSLSLNFADFQQNDGDDAAWTRMAARVTALSTFYGRGPAVYFPRGVYKFFSMKTMWQGMVLIGEGDWDYFGAHVQFENNTTDMFGWGAASTIKGARFVGIAFIGQATRAANSAYALAPFDQTAYPAKNLQYSTIERCSFQYFKTMSVYFGGGTIRDCNFAHFSDVPLKLGGYDWVCENIFLGVDVATTFASFVATPALTASATGGSLSDGTYYVRTTGVTANGETSVTPAQTITLSGGGSSQSINMAATSATQSGVTGYNVYVSTTNAANSFFRVNGGTPIAPGATYTVTTAPGSGTQPNPWVYDPTKPLVMVDNVQNWKMTSMFPTITSGGPGLLVQNGSGGFCDAFKADGYNTQNPTQYGQNGAGIKLVSTSDITLVGPRIHGTMGTSQDPASLFIQNSSHISILGASYVYQPTGTGTIGFGGTCSDITMVGSHYDTAEGVGRRNDASGATVTNFRWDEVPSAGAPGPTLWTSPTAWSVGTTYTRSTAPYPSVTRNGSWYGLASTNTGQDPATDAPGTYWTLLAQAGSTASNFGGLFGDGSDGSATLDGTATVTWANKSGSTYTLNKDVNLTTLTVNSGVTVKTNGCFILALTSVTNNGTIGNDGVAGNAAGVGGGGAPGFSFVAGGAGGTGVVGAGGAGGSGGATGALGGTGGTGVSAGGASGAIPSGGASRARIPHVLLTGQFAINGTTRFVGGGAGGGAGGGDGTNKGGGGGGAGGAVAILSPTITNNGVVSANGAAGGTPTVGNCGGGAGGGGGFIAVMSQTYTGSGTVVANGGAAGSGVGTGVAGAVGAAGNVFNLTLH